MDLKTQKIYKKEKINSFYLSIWFLIISILITTGLYFYNLNIIKANAEINSNIKIKTKSISELEKDPNVIASSLYNLNKTSINKLEDYSKITTYINHIYDLSKTYNINFKGFNYSLGKLNTTVIANSDSFWNINYMKAAKFIKEYRENVNNNFLFDLELVKSVTTKDDWASNEFNIDLVLKNNIFKIISDFKNTDLIEENIQSKEEKIKSEELKKKIEAFEKLKEEKDKSQNNSGSIIE